MTPEMAAEMDDLRARVASQAAELASQAAEIASLRDQLTSRPTAGAAAAVAEGAAGSDLPDSPSMARLRLSLSDSLAVQSSQASRIHDLTTAMRNLQNTLQAQREGQEGANGFAQWTPTKVSNVASQHGVDATAALNSQLLTSAFFLCSLPCCCVARV